ncbi:Fc.00g087140.m01.CDS01 [Cosmosporella sp. VM-42]
MAMDALKNLTNNIPDWLKRLDDLSGQIDRRQAELAAVAASEGRSPETKSLRNKGSTESLKPRDDGGSPFGAPVESPAEDIIPEDAPLEQAPTPPADTQKNTPISASPPSPSAVKQTREAMMAARSRVRAQVKKRHRASSMVSAEGAPPAYRTRSMIIVYYDSYVQGFFDELVRFVSSSRNLMRKAKMAAKVAQIKRMAEMDVSEDGNGSGDDKLETLPSLRYMSTRRFGPSISRPGFGPPGNNQPPDAYDNLDKALEFVQSMCEHGAHQFLRDGDCNDEITKVQKRLAEVLEMAAKETERVQREEPELAKETGELGKIRTRRPISMRRELSPGLKDSSPTPTREQTPKLEPAKLEPAKSEPAKPEAIQVDDNMDVSKPLEVDPNLEADEGIEVDMELPKLQYRSTRGMRNRRP